MKNKLKEIKGITLIALVITIIVLLILAGVSIAMLTGENGILTQANNASKQTEIAEAKERAKLDILEWRTNQIRNKEDATLNAATIKDILSKSTTKGEYIKGEPGDNSFFTKSGYEILYSELDSSIQTGGGAEQAVVGEKVTGSNKEYTTTDGTAVIPVGFTIVPGCDDISEGLVISDNENDTEANPDEIVANGNQFVWVPVSKDNFATEFVRHDFSNEGIPDADFVSGAPNSGYAEYAGDGETVNEDVSESEQEAQRMYKSVKENGGFYIGRYEAGNDGSDNVISKKGVDVYNNIIWSDSQDDFLVETGGLVEKAREFDTANNYTSVTSTLVYGVQWDAVMRWISSDESLSDYLTDSSDVGNYDTHEIIQTGSVQEYQVKNIFDMAGNVWEWTMEADGTDYRVLRGGSSMSDVTPITDRYSSIISIPYISSDDVGFRVTLYL